LTGTSGSFGGAGVAAAADVVAADAEPLFAGAGTLAAEPLAGVAGFAVVLVAFGDAFSDLPFDDGVTVFTLALVGDALAPGFEAVATAGSA